MVVALFLIFFLNKNLLFCSPPIKIQVVMLRLAVETPAIACDCTCTTFPLKLRSVLAIQRSNHRR